VTDEFEAWLEKDIRLTTFEEDNDTDHANPWRYALEHALNKYREFKKSRCCDNCKYVLEEDGELCRHSNPMEMTYKFSCCFFTRKLDKG